MSRTYRKKYPIELGGPFEAIKGQKITLFSLKAQITPNCKLTEYEHLRSCKMPKDVIYQLKVQASLNILPKYV